VLGLIITLHVFLCILIIIAVLLQQGQGSDLASIFGGGGGASPIIRGRAAMSLLNKVTIVCFVLFIGTSLAISILQRRRAEVRPPLPTVPAPTAPASPTPSPPTAPAPQK